MPKASKAMKLKALVKRKKPSYPGELISQKNKLSK